MSLSRQYVALPRYAKQKIPSLPARTLVGLVWGFLFLIVIG
jgi:hypothetical protein